MLKIILSTSVIFLTIAAVRRFFRGKAGSVFLYSLWLLFAAGLVIPVFFAILQNITSLELIQPKSPISIMNLLQTVSRTNDQSQSGAPDRQTDKMTESGSGNSRTEKTGKKNAAVSNRMKKTAKSNILSSHILLLIWAAGAAAIVICQLLTELTFRLKLTENRVAISYHGQKAYIAEGITTPLLFRGRGLSSEIYLPKAIMENETLIRHAILHESIHKKHGDIWWGYLRNMLTAAYWFDPFVWAAAVLSKRDCEYACDSSVMKNMNQKERISYGNSLLSLVQTEGRQSLFCTATAMKIGKSEMEVRIRMIKNGRKRSIFSAVIISLLLCAAGFVAFTDAAETEKTSSQNEQEPNSSQNEQEPNSSQNKQEANSSQNEQEQLPDQNEPSNTLSAKNAEYLLTDSWGADPPYIYYEDDKSMIFSGYFGLFVYSREANEIVQSLNLKEIGCHMTQGDNYCQIDVAEDGKTVYLKAAGDTKMYQYTIDTKELQYLDYKLPDQLYNSEEGDKADKSGILCKGSTIGDLVYWYDDGGVMIKYEPLFYQPYGSCDSFRPEDLHDLSEVSFYADGKEYVITEEEKLKWIEKHLSDSAEKIDGVPACPFYRMMYLKRKDGACGWIFPATDSCSVYQAGDSYYDYKEPSNEAFWKQFGIDDVNMLN